MYQGRPKRLAVVLGLLLAFVVVMGGWAQPQSQTPSPQQRSQAGPGMMGPGTMMGGTMMPMGGMMMMPMMSEMNQMMQMCSQVMAQKMGTTPLAPGSAAK